jgi:formyl-CoA transferase
MPGPLSHIRVLDLSRVLAGPWAAQNLGDLGAEVIKVERPGAGDDTRGWGPPFMKDQDGKDTSEAAYFLSVNRNKKSVTLDISKPEGQAIVRELAAKCQVLVENYKVGALKKYGLDYDSLKQVNPSLIYCSVTGFGQDGPYAERAGFDQIAQGMGGLMWITGMPGGGPVRAGIAVADVGAGLHCAIGVLIALLERENSGQGQWVSSSLLQAMISMCDFQAARWTIAKDVPGQAGNNHPTSIPTGVFQTKDGYINIAASGGHIYKRFCESIKAPELMTDERFSTDKARAKNRDVLNAEIDKRLTTYTSAELVEKLNKAGVPAGPIYKMDEMFADPQVKHLKMAHPVKSPKLGDIELIGQAINMSRTQFEMKSATPEQGEHTESVLKEFGYDAAAIADFRKRKVI